MEILQEIWTVLTAENENLANILECPLILIESYLYMLFFTTLLKINASRKTKYTFVLTFGFIAILSILFVPSPYYTYINVICFPILVFFIFKQSIFVSVLCEIIVYFLIFLIATPLVMIYSLFVKIPSASIAILPIHKIIYSVLLDSLIYVVCKIVAKYNINLSVLKKLKNKISKTLLINFIMGILAIAIQCYIEFLYLDYIPIYLIILCTLVLVIYFIISIFSLFRTTKLETITEKLEEEKLYNQTLTLLYDNIRGFKHDFNNIVQGIGGYISTNNMEGLKTYYSEVLDDCQRVNNLSLLSPEIINNPAIYSLLTSKYFSAMELGIKMNLEVFMDLSTISMKIYELTRILGILIDNAIEAAKDCSEKVINITIRKDNRLNKQLFIIENTYSNKDVNIDEIFEKGKTSKSNEDSKNHGLGLWEVRNIIKKHKNLNLYTSKDEKYFKQQFEIF